MDKSNLSDISPLITIVTVVFNNVATLEKTIQSILNQSYKNIEYIIIDGGSSDGTLDIIKKYNDRISCWISEKDIGIYDAMNKSLKYITGDWVIFINADDHFVSPFVLSNVIPHLESLIQFTMEIFYLMGKYFMVANLMLFACLE